MMWSRVWPWRAAADAWKLLEMMTARNFEAKTWDEQLVEM